MDFSQIKKIENGQLFFSDLDNEGSIDLRKRRIAGFKTKIM